MTTERKTERDDFDQEVVFEPQENEAVYPKKKEYNSKRELKEFKKQIANIEFNPLGSRDSIENQLNLYPFFLHYINISKTRIHLYNGEMINIHLHKINIQILV